MLEFLSKMDTEDIISWSAVLILSSSYWFQIWKIHVHKEVRDLSIVSYLLLAVGFAIMANRAFQDEVFIFLIKQLATLIPCLIIVAQIIYHKNDHWHDDHDPMCSRCKQELELDWDFCAYCGQQKEEDQ